MLRVGYLCTADPYEPWSFSGTGHHAWRALDARSDMDVTALGWRRLPRLASKLARKAGIKRGPTAETLSDAGLDAIVSMVGSNIVADFLPRARVPIVNVTDGTPKFVDEFYGMARSAEDVAREAEVVRRSALTLYSSEWMMHRALEEFAPLDPARVAFAPFGLNIEDAPDVPPEKPAPAPLRLFFIGRQWERKGGPLLLQVHEALRAGGTDVRLDIVGCRPEAAERIPGVHVHGMLDKSDPEEGPLLRGLFRDAHLFVLPTRADCTPMVVAEANAFGTPVIITEVGGIASLVETGVNGRLMRPEDDAAAWAAAIREAMADPAAYAALSRSAHAFRARRLTWESWGQTVSDHLHRIVGARAA